MHLNTRIAALLAALALLSALSSVPVRADPGPIAVAPLPPVANPDGRFGIVQGVAAPDLALNAGARWDRVIFPWSLIQRDGPDSWKELYYSDEIIRAQAGRGVTMVGVIIYTPQWASIDPPRGRPIDRPQGLNLPYNDAKNYWGQFVRKLVARHKGVVDNWVVWNEPDLFDPSTRYTWDGSYEEYAQLLKVAYLNIKEVNPKARVIAGGFAYWWDKHYGRPPYLGPLLEVIARDPEARRNNHYFDVVSLHAYSAPLNSYTQPLIFREILELRGIKKPIWISESNVVPYDDPSNPLPPGGLRATLDQQASYVIQSMALALAAGVDRYGIYKLVDEAPENNTEMWGLARNDLSLKPAYVAYQVGATYFSNVRSAVYSWPGSAEVPTPEQVKSILTSNANRVQFIWPAQLSQVVLERGPKRTTVVWNNSPLDVTHRVPATARRATLVTKFGKTDTITARDGFYVIDLPGSQHNPDIRDYSIYMIGGEPFIIDEEVRPLPTDRVASRIEIVWPRDGAETKDAERANVTAQLLMPGPANESVPCRYKPDNVQLWSKPNGGEKEFVGDGVRRMAEADGLRYPVWDFNEVNVGFARDPKNFYEYYVVVDGVQTEATVWTYGGPNGNDWRQPPQRPARGCE
ncbi:MAG TPA: hypothetical protein VEQ11_06590 [Chloroflexota bacterium]|nr:hypothetical protein [Chloroflexota bacterium]